MAKISAQYAKKAVEMRHYTVSGRTLRTGVHCRCH